jgi:hypothetical protein
MITMYQHSGPMLSTACVRVEISTGGDPDNAGDSELTGRWLHAEELLHRHCLLTTDELDALFPGWIGRTSNILQW